MKKIISFIVCLSMTLCLVPVVNALAAPGNSAHAIVLMHPDTGNILYEENADERMLIASTTKVMTALVVLDRCQPDELVTVSRESTLIEGSSMYLKAGEEYTVESLLYGLMLVSGNDAAHALACHAAGSVEAFADLMNQKARDLELKNSSFKNPHGLDAEGHYGSARDLAVIMSAAMENELFARICGTKSYTHDEQTYINHNKLLWNYPDVIGGKTGYTMAAGRSLITCAQRDGVRLVCVTLSDPDDWADHIAIYDWAFGSHEYKNPLPAGELISLPVISGVSDSVGIAVNGELRVLMQSNQEPELELLLPQFVFAGVNAGEKAGEVIVRISGREVGRAELCYTRSVRLEEEIKLSPWERFKRAWFISNTRLPSGVSYYPIWSAAYPAHM